MPQKDPRGIDPRVARTRRDVIDATTTLFLQEGWEAVTHAEVARRAGFSKATVYTHWPSRLDLIRATVEQICDAAAHPEPTGDLRADLIAGLADFAADLSDGHLDRVLGGILERAGSDPVVDDLRRMVYEAGTRSMEAILRSHLREPDVEPSLALLVGAVLVRGAFEGSGATQDFIEDLVDRVLSASGAPK